MAEEDRIYHLLRGMEPALAAIVRERECKTLDKAIKLAVHKHETRMQNRAGRTDGGMGAVAALQANEGREQKDAVDDDNGEEAPLSRRTIGNLMQEAMVAAIRATSGGYTNGGGRRPNERRNGEQGGSRWPSQQGGSSAGRRVTGRPVTCFICNKPGHIARDCTNASERVCFNCDRPGHIASECRQPRKTRTPAPLN